MFWKKKKSEAPTQPQIIAIASGKGGVGKSTVTTQLAYALAQKGARVGILDADVYGPSQPTLLGQHAAQTTPEGHLVPAQAHGIKFISMGLLTAADKPIVWRAPIANRMLQQFLTQVEWGPLDTLFLDLPPGTGDIQITLAQSASLSGAVIVTTPQDVAVGVAKRGLKMFEPLNVPILGIIENMSGHVCEHCEQSTSIFKKGGGESLARELGFPFLGAIPLDRALTESCDLGLPVALKFPNSPSAQAFQEISKNLMTVARTQTATPEPTAFNITSGIEGSPARALQISWPDQGQTLWASYTLRMVCGCASCVDENTGQRKLKPEQVPLDIALTQATRVGRYGLSLSFSDNHTTGIYPYSLLRKPPAPTPQTEAFTV